MKEVIKSSEDNFDFDNHRKKAIQDYQKVRDLYLRFSDVVKKILIETVNNSCIKVASIEARAKTIESFANKATLPSESNPLQPKYRNPMTDITDFAGVRIITFFPRTVQEVNDVIESEFQILEKSDKGELLKQEGKFGYQSIHYLIKLKPNRVTLPEYHIFNNLIAEVQVRTILQHAWAEIEHDISYKSVETIPTLIHRRFISLAGLLEIADREFQAIQDEDQILIQKARESVSEGRLEDVEITPDALKSYLDKKLGPDGRMTDFSYDWTARLLRGLGFKNFRQINECIAGYDDDTLSRILWGTRAGQLTRFEVLLLAGMSENYITKHFWKDSDWFPDRQRKLLEILKNAGIKIGHYLPT
jgi:putative GTP pyrophosphokinase